MYIISKHKDYYDGVVGTMGVDKTIVYDREILEFEKNEIPKLFNEKTSFWKDRKKPSFTNIGYHSIKKEYRKKYDDNAFFIVGFCGKLYVGWKLYKEIQHPDIITANKLITTITYDFELIKTLLEPHSFHVNLEDSYNYTKTFNALDIFRELKVPIFIYDNDFNRTSIGRYYNRTNPKFTLNANLAEYEFYKVFNSFQAFQEVSMFMGGVLGRGEKEIVEVGDKYKIAQHGFDKWSFRKMPENGKN
jgi:hypothetical protein